MKKCRNEVEHRLRRLKCYRRILSHFEKLDMLFTAFISAALIADGLRLCQLALNHASATAEIS